MSREYLDQCPLCENDKPAWAQYDARGIFLCFACDDCRGRELSKYRPEVLTDPDYWAAEPIEEDE